MGGAMASHLTNTEFQIGTTQTISSINTSVTNTNSAVPTSAAVKALVDGAKNAKGGN